MFPILTCKSECRKTKGSSRVTVGFTCLPRHSALAKEWTQKVREVGSLGVLAPNYLVTVQERVRVPEQCVPLVA